MRKLVLLFLGFVLFFTINSFSQCTFQAPYYEDFENGGLIPNCWEQGANNNEDWLFSNDLTISGHIGRYGNVFGTQTRSGGYFAWVEDSSPNSLNTQLITPDIDLTGITNPTLSFYYISDDEFFNKHVDFSIVLLRDSGDIVLFSSNTTNTNGWKQEFIDLSAYMNQTIRVAFVVDEISASTRDDLAIDDIFVGEMPTCIIVNSIQADNITTNSATISWLDNNSPIASAWEIEYGEIGFTQGNGTILSVNSNPYTITGLSTNTEYDVYVRANCGAFDGVSFWIGPLSFTTVVLAPYFEDFENNGDIPFNFTQATSDTDDWQFSNQVYNVGGSNGDFKNTFTLSNNYFAYVDDMGGSDNREAVILTPLIDISTLSNPILSFYYISDRGNDTANVRFKVQVWNGSSWGVAVHYSYSNTNGWELVQYDLSSYLAQGTIQIRFSVEDIANNTYNDDLAIDDVYIGEMRTCLSVNTITSNNTIDSALISWEDYGVSTIDWDIEYGEADFTQGDGTLLSTTSNSVLISALSSDTIYDVYIKTNCSSGEYNNWIGPMQFRTLISCFPVTNIAITNITETTATINWNDSQNTGANYRIQLYNGLNELIVDEIVNTSTYVFNNLNVLQNYTYLVNAICGTDDESTMVQRSFVTSSPSIVVDYPYNVAPLPYKIYTNTLSAIRYNLDDIYSDLINLNFNFNYFGIPYNQVAIGTNSVISFDANDALSYCSWKLTGSYNVPIPSTIIIDNAILGAYQDYYDFSSDQGVIGFGHIGNAPFRKFVVFFDDVNLYPSNSSSACFTITSTNQMILYETYNFIDVQVKDRNPCTAWNEGRAIIGIQSYGGAYAYVAPNRNTGDWEAHDEGWRFRPVQNHPDYQYIICDANVDGVEMFDLNTIYAHFGDSTTNTYAAFETLSDAENNINNISTTNYTNRTNAQTIFVRELTTAGDISIKQVLLATIDCTADYDLDTIATADEDLNNNGNYGDDDTDGDQIPDFLDEDDDGDYVLTSVEALITTNRNTNNTTNYIDTDGDQIPNYLDNEDDGDGILSLDEDANGNYNLLDDDTDGDNIPDYLDNEVLSVNNYQIDFFEVYPNPAKDKLTIKLNKEQLNVMVKIYTLQGQQVYSKKDINTTLEINVSDFSNGVYFVNLVGNNQTYIKKFVKE